MPLYLIKTTIVLLIKSGILLLTYCPSIQSTIGFEMADRCKWNLERNLKSTNPEVRKATQPFFACIAEYIG